MPCWHDVAQHGGAGREPWRATGRQRKEYRSGGNNEQIRCKRERSVERQRAAGQQYRGEHRIGEHQVEQREWSVHAGGRAGPWQRQAELARAAAATASLPARLLLLLLPAVWPIHGQSLLLKLLL